MKSREKIENMFVGLALADALGVPFEFKSREALKRFPADTMIGHGTYNQPKGTWSDDSSLTFCLAESLINGYDLLDIASKFIAWKREEIWTPYGEVFDIGVQTARAIETVSYFVEKNDLDSIKNLKYNTNEYTNGNGALMRIIPLVFYLKGMEIDKQFEIIRDVSALTHPHIRSAISCLIYLKFAEYVLNGFEIRKAYEAMKKEVKPFFIDNEISEREVNLFERLINHDISTLEENEIKSSGYVVHTLEASFWCLLNTSGYKESVFKAINLGEDTDTTACVVGGVAGLHYGLKNIPEDWIKNLARIESIKSLVKEFNKTFN